MTMDLDLELRVEVPSDTLLRELEGEAVILNLQSGHYYSLDPVGTSIWRALTSAASVGEAIAVLLDEFDVDRETLERDVGAMVAELRDEGLIRLA